MGIKKILFVLNPLSGNKDKDYQVEIENHFHSLPQFDISFIEPNWDKNPKNDLESEIAKNSYDAVVASGGDGTVRFVTEILYGSKIKMGILPTGSANGLAQNLLIPQNINIALTVIQEGKTMPVSSLTVNDIFCIHIADIGLNADIVRRFDRIEQRGFIGYLKAFLNVAFKQKRVKAKITMDNSVYDEKFYMLVFANGTGYGTGFTINPAGRLDDNKFEIVKINKISYIEALRLYLGKEKPHADVVSIHPCQHVKVKTRKPVHLQIDGEYIGKTRDIKVDFNGSFINMIVPTNYNHTETSKQSTNR